MAKLPKDNTPRKCITCGQVKPAVDFHRLHGRAPRKRCAACVENRKDGRGKAGIYVVNAATSHAFWTRVSAGMKCWTWTGPRNSRGYGTFFYKGRPYLAHRFSHLLHFAELPPEKCVCHTCDNRLCVNPGHLFLGTVTDNTLDRDRKDRVQWGDRHWKAKLTPQDVRAIRASTESSAEIAKRFGVGQSYIYRLKSREKWSRLN